MQQTLDQFPVFLFMLYCGLVIGVLYDLFRLLRLPFSSAIVSGILDGAFYMLAGAIFALSLLYANNGEFRFYTLIASGVGIFIEQRFTGALFVDLLHKIAARTSKRG